MLRDVNREPIAFVRVDSLTMRAIGSEPFASIGNAYC
jgi:hypothetical protein